VYTGNPQALENYNEYLADDIRVYTLKGYFGSARMIKITLGSMRGNPVLQVNRIE